MAVSSGSVTTAGHTAAATLNSGAVVPPTGGFFAPEYWDPVFGNIYWQACTSAAASQSPARRVSEAVSLGQPHTPDLLIINPPKLFLSNIFCTYKLTEVDKSLQTEVDRCLQGLAKVTNVKVLLEISSSQTQSLFFSWDQAKECVRATGLQSVKFL